MIEPRIELGTLCVLSICHNQLDHPTICEGHSSGYGVDVERWLGLLQCPMTLKNLDPIVLHLESNREDRPVIWQFVRAVKEKD